MTKCSIWSKTISDFWMRSNSTFPTYSEEAWFHGSQPKDIHDSESHWSCKTSWIRDNNFRWELLRGARDRKERCIYKNPLRWNTRCCPHDFCTRFFCISKRENRESRWNDYSTLIPYKNVSKKPQNLRFFFFSVPFKRSYHPSLLTHVQKVKGISRVSETLSLSQEGRNPCQQRTESWIPISPKESNEVESPTRK